MTRTPQHKLLPLVLVSTMIASTFQMFAIGVLAAPMLEDLGTSRWALGAVGAINTMVGAASAPLTGRLTDRIGPRRSILVIWGFGATGMGLMAASSNLWMLAAAGVVSGIPQGWGNPATNALIAQQVEPGRRGTITGIKQSGVTFALFLSGATLPFLATLTDWQTATGIFAGVFAVFGLVNSRLLRTDSLAPAGAQSLGTGAQKGTATKTPVPPFVWNMSVYAFLMGTSSGAIGRFLPLFAEEVIGMARTPAGMLIAVVGVCGVVFRIAAARLAEHHFAPQSMLVTLSLVAVAASVLLLSATRVGPWVLWPVAVLYALGHISWNAVVHLAIINTVPQQDAGRFSGIIMLGFLFGMTIGAPITGWVVDTYDSYQPVWSGAAALAVVAAGIAAPRRRSARTT